ncbi:MAG TPA: FkbM family methyltransferase [Terracidiphilus sp.]|nr:FkbM family methyltransferase [Terracidiphilus sp.]
MSLREGFNGYRRTLGIRGVAAMALYRAVGFPRRLRAHVRGLDHPVWLRMRTSDVSVLSGILLGNEYEIDLPMPPRIILDAGANIGMASIFFARRYPQARIIAVEAEQSNFEVLVRNVAPYPQVTPIRAALWNRDTEIRLRYPYAKSGAVDKSAFLVDETSDGASVRAVTLRTLLAELKIEVLDLIKVDIEGAEFELFEDPAPLLRAQCIMVEIHEGLRPGCSARIRDSLGAFECSRRRETTFFRRRETNLLN